MKLNRLCRPGNLAFSLLVLCFIVTAETPRRQKHDAIKPIGCFVNVQSDSEHADGYSVKLWTRGRSIIGLVDYYEGSPEDSPIGLLSEVRYDSLTGKLSFKAKLTSGLHYCRVHKNIPSHDLLSFDGFLKADRLEGKIVLEEQLDSPPVVMDRRDDFLMRKDNDCELVRYENYESWWSYWEPVYEFRGPKW